MSEHSSRLKRFPGITDKDQKPPDQEPSHSSDPQVGTTRLPNTSPGPCLPEHPILCLQHEQALKQSPRPP